MNDPENAQKITDSIPRVGIAQILETVAALASASAPAKFEDVRKVLHRQSARQAPASPEAMWTVARDALSDLQKLGYANVGPLPRKRSEVERLRETPCELTDSGHALAKLFLDKKTRGRAYDELLIAWLNDHRYYRLFQERLLHGPLHVPDVTTLKQVGLPDQNSSLADRVIGSCVTRLAAIDQPVAKREIFAASVRERVAYIESQYSLHDLDAKKWIDIVQDLVVIPAFLTAEGLPFDAVTFQHMVRISQDFLSAAWTSSYPGFDGRVIFQTCEFDPPISDETARVAAIHHHGKSYASEGFAQALQAAHRQLAGPRSGYVDAYALRALVCVRKSIQPRIFASCLDDTIRGGPANGLTLYTELPFTPPPQGESYLEIGTRRIGLIKVVAPPGE